MLHAEVPPIAMPCQKFQISRFDYTHPGQGFSAAQSYGLSVVKPKQRDFGEAAGGRQYAPRQLEGSLRSRDGRNISAHCPDEGRRVLFWFYAKEG